MSPLINIYLGRNLETHMHTDLLVNELPEPAKIGILSKYLVKIKYFSFNLIDAVIIFLVTEMMPGCLQTTLNEEYKCRIKPCSGYPLS